MSRFSTIVLIIVSFLAIQHVASAFRMYKFTDKLTNSLSNERKGVSGLEKVATYTTLCIPTTSSLLEDHEGRHSCAYNTSVGYRAVGVGYNLDEDVETKRTELSGVLANYDKVYAGEDCLNDLQINALLALDAKRALDHASDVAKAMGDWCCSVQSSFADIAFNAGKETLESDENLKDLIEKASSQKWEDAASALEESDWCNDNQSRCEDDSDKIREGCSTFQVQAGEVLSII